MKKGPILFQSIMFIIILGVILFYEPSGNWYQKIAKRYDYGVILTFKLIAGIVILNYLAFFKMIYDFSIIKLGKKMEGVVIDYKIGFFLFRAGKAPVVEYTENSELKRFKYNAYVPSSKIKYLKANFFFS